MKKKTGITKTLALVLTLGLLCSGLTGCGQTRNSGSAAESLMTESTQPAESTEAVMESTEATAENTDEDDTVVRVASLKDMVHAEYDKKDIAGMTPSKQLEEISKVTHEFMRDQYRTRSCR